MKIISFILISILFNLTLQAQEDSTVVNAWSTSGVVALNLSQTSLSNWAKGGDNSFAFSLLGDFNADYQGETWKLTNYLKLNWGRSKVGTNDTKVTDNELILENLLSREISWDIKPYISNTIRTQLVKGYDYDVDPPVEVAAFFDPGYITQEIGFVYDKPEWFQTRLGIGFKETITNKFNSASDDTETEEVEKFKFEIGLASVTEAGFTVAENLGFKTKLSLFGRFDDMAWWDVYSDNTLTAKVNNFLNVNLSVSIVYNKLETVKTQIKEVLQIGFTYTIF
jgi:hypothetical protein